MQIELDVTIGPQGAMRRSEAFSSALTLSGDDDPQKLPALCIARRGARNAQKSLKMPAKTEVFSKLDSSLPLGHAASWTAGMGGRQGEQGND